MTAKKPLDERALRSLATLLDEEDPDSLRLVRDQILRVGEPMLPFLEEFRARAETSVAARVEAVAGELRFTGLKRDFAALARQVRPDLETGAFLLARFCYPALDDKPYRLWLDRVAEKVQDDLPSDADHALILQRLSSMLFQAMGFSGNESRYYDPDNSCLNRVIDSRRGIPISLSVLFLLLAKRLRLPAYGVGAPGHFLVGFKAGPYPCFLDAFHKGRLLDLSEVRRLLSRSGYQFRPEFVSPCSERDIIIRMLRNLLALYDKMGATARAERLGVLTELLLRRGR